MRHFAEELSRQIEAAKLSQGALAEAAGIAQAQIWKWVNGEQISINAEQLDAIARALKATPSEHARLLAAHLEDERFGKAAGAVRIEIETAAEMRDRPRPRTRGEAALQTLAELRLQSREVNDLLIDLANCLGADI